MCTPIVIDGTIDLSNDPNPKFDASSLPTNPAGTGDPAPGPKTGTVVDPASAGPETLPVLTNPITLGGGPGAATSKTPGDQPAGSTPATSGPDPAAPAATTPMDQNTLLINSLTDMAHRFTDTTAGILTAQSDASNALKDGFLDLNKAQQDALAAADQLRKNTGQSGRKPSYSLSLDANRRANSGGVASTMLTGSQGVPTNTLALGRAQLLGGAAA